MKSEEFSTEAFRTIQTDAQAVVDALNEFGLRLREAGEAMADAIIASGLLDGDGVLSDETGGALIEELIPEAVAEWKAVRDE